MFYAAYLSEIFRAALTGVHPGQKEAAEALGMSRLTTPLESGGASRSIDTGRTAPGSIDCAVGPVAAAILTAPSP